MLTLFQKTSSSALLLCFQMTLSLCWGSQEEICGLLQQQWNVQWLAEEHVEKDKKWSSLCLICHCFPDVDTTKDPCQKVKCSRHKVCIAQGYQRAVCVNRKKLEHRWVCVACEQELTNSPNPQIVINPPNAHWHEVNTTTLLCVKVECILLLARVGIMKLVCASLRYNFLLFNDKLIHSDNMEEAVCVMLSCSD